MPEAVRPNIVFVMSDDHAAHAIGAYGSVVNRTPHMDRLAEQGMRLDGCLCTNALCAPSRASILTGTYGHVNGVRTLFEKIDASQPTFVSQLRGAGYQTALIGKWHLGDGPGHDPEGFDHWEVLPGQGDYHDPRFITPDGEVVREGYATSIITDRSLAWLDSRDPDRPFCLLVHHKAPHRPWEPDPSRAKAVVEKEIPVPETYDDDYAHRAAAAERATMRVRRDLNKTDLKEDPPPGLSEQEHAVWAYRRYMADYVDCIASVDDSVGAVLDYLDDAGLAEDTIVIYTSDQGFFLGDHGWYDKRFMYEESLRMPFLVRYPREIPAGSVGTTLVSNVDFAQTFLDYAGVESLDRMQGRSFRDVLAGTPDPERREAVYYRYWEHDSRPHHVQAHYGVRTPHHKLIYYARGGSGVPGTSDREFPEEWELFDLDRDPRELRSVYDDPAYASVRAELTDLLETLQREVGDTPLHKG